MEKVIDRAALANRYHDEGYSCAQAVACAFCDVIPYKAEELAPILGCFGGGFRCGEICGVVSGAAVVLGLYWPHSIAGDLAAKERAAEKMREFHRRFLERFPSLRCAEIKELPAAPDKSPSAARLGLQRPCPVYIVAAVEILEEMLEEGCKEEGRSQ